jgi:hypothetical protein
MAIALVKTPAVGTQAATNTNTLTVTINSTAKSTLVAAICTDLTDLLYQVESLRQQLMNGATRPVALRGRTNTPRPQ